jgi:hypothetical protein
VRAVIVRDLICTSHPPIAQHLSLYPHTFLGATGGIERWQCECGEVRMERAGSVTDETAEEQRQ